MGFDLVMITTGSRPRLLEQSLRSLRENAADWSQHYLTLVMDGCSVMDVCLMAGTAPDRIIINPRRQGASRSRNIGASSTPKYLRQNAVCFFDDDVYCCKGWDEQVDALLGNWVAPIVSGHAHPYNHTVLSAGKSWYSTTVLSTVHVAMPWRVWDHVGFWTEPGGAGGSEDVDYCNRAMASAYATGVILVVAQPQCILHTGIGSTSGSRLIGWELVMDNNHQLEQVHGIQGKVLYE